jgi:hypothetical protein
MQEGLKGHKLSRYRMKIYVLLLVLIWAVCVLSFPQLETTAENATETVRERAMELTFSFFVVLEMVKTSSVSKLKRRPKTYIIHENGKFIQRKDSSLRPEVQVLNRYRAKKLTLSWAQGVFEDLRFFTHEEHISERK